jgi:hypothetical protein
LLPTPDVFPNGKWELGEQRKEAKQERKFIDVPEPVALKDAGL